MRKVGKLPSKTVKVSYDLEYGSDSLEMHDDAIEKGQRVLIVDDLLATGGTAKATVDLVRQLGGQVEGLAFLIELVALNGRSKLQGEQLFSLRTERPPRTHRSRRARAIASRERLLEQVVPAVRPASELAKRRPRHPPKPRDLGIQRLRGRGDDIRAQQNALPGMVVDEHLA